MDTLTWTIFDVLGTIAFAVSGAMVGMEKRMDIFGIIVLALLTAVGGGMIRDVLAGNTPPLALRDVTDFLLSIVVAVLVTYLYSVLPLSRKSRRLFARAYNVCDTIGLASFTITGMLIGLAAPAGHPLVLPVLLGVITAVGGGVLRDLMAGRMPAVLYKDIYATASLLGAIPACLAAPHLSLTAASWLCFFLVTFLRFIALHFGWHLIHPRRHYRRHRHNM